MPLSLRILTWTLILAGLYLTSLYHYLLFHGLAELFSIMVAGGIFMIAWNSRRFLPNHFLLFIGIAYLFIAGLDLLHTLAYKGMNIFPGYDSNLATQLWIAGRYLESLSLLIAPLFLQRKVKPELVFGVYTSILVILLVSVFYWQIFPACFVEESGLTPFKKISEYIIALILLVSIGLLTQRRKEFDPGIYWLVCASIVVTILSELTFTFYVNVYGFSNLIGHFLKIISFYLIYKAIIETGLVRPYGLLFRDLKQREKELEESLEEKETLLREVHHRVKNNLQVIISFLRLQSGRIEDAKYAKMFEDSQNRIRSMALIHEMLYKSQKLSKIDFKTYVRDLSRSLFRSHGINIDTIALKLDLADAHFGLDCAISCGILLNELITNALAHAFPGNRHGEIRISVDVNNKDEVELKVADNGIGIPPDIDFRQTKTLGLRLINILVEDQLEGTIKLDRQNGTEFNIRFRCARNRA